MDRWQRRALQKLTDDFLRALFAPDPAPIYTDPETGEQAIDIRKVCEKLGIDPDREVEKILTDPILSQGYRVVTRRQAD